jgi:hypothetical protein
MSSTGHSKSGPSPPEGLLGLAVVEGRVVGAAVDGRVVGAEVDGRVVGLAVEGRVVGAAVDGRVVGAAVEGRVVGFAVEGRVVGFAVEGLVVGAAVVEVVVGLGVGCNPGLQVCDDGQVHTLMKSLYSRPPGGQSFRKGCPLLHCQNVAQLSGFGYRHWLITQSSTGQVNA